MTVRTWILAGVALVVAFMVSCVALVGSLTYFVVKRVHVAPVVKTTDAQERIDKIRERFKDQEPLLVWREDEGHRKGAFRVDADELRDKIEERAKNYSGPLPESVHVLIWDADEEKLVNFSLPLWLLKLKTGPIDVNAGGFRLRRFRVTAADLERAGPGLVLDFQDHETEVLVWTE